MHTSSRFTLWHHVDLKSQSVYLSIDWEYQSRIPHTYHDPECPESVDLIRVNIPEELETIGEEVRWAVEDNLADLEIEALEQIGETFEKWRTVGNEYA